MSVLGCKRNVHLESRVFCGRNARMITATIQAMLKTIHNISHSHPYLSHLAFQVLWAGVDDCLRSFLLTDAVAVSMVDSKPPGAEQLELVQLCPLKTQHADGY